MIYLFIVFFARLKLLTYNCLPTTFLRGLPTIDSQMKRSQKKNIKKKSTVDSSLFNSFRDQIMDQQSFT